MSENVFLVNRAITNIMNDVIQKAFHYSIHHPQDSDSLNRLIKDATEDTSKFVNELNVLSKECEESELDERLQDLSKRLKKQSLVHLADLQKIQQKNASAEAGKVND